MINCGNFSENVCAYIDNELNIEERLSFDEHVRNCKGCKRELDEMIRIVNLCTELPQQELPAGFREELHEKLVAVAGRKDTRDEPISKVTDLKKTKKFLFLKTFAAIAAGVLLVFLAGNFFKFGLFSPAKTENSASSNALAMEEPAAAGDEGSAQIYGNASDSDPAGGEESKAEAFSAPAAASAGTAVDRSAAVQNRDTAAKMNTTSETVSSKLSTITVTTGDPGAQTEKIRSLAAKYNGEAVDDSLTVSFSEDMTASKNSDGDQSNSTQTEGTKSNDMQTFDIQAKSIQPGIASGAGESAGEAGNTAPVQLNFIIPETQYRQFVDALNAEFGKANVQAGTLVTKDVTDVLNNSIKESGELDNRIQELQKEDSEKNAQEIDKLKAQKESADKRIDELRLGSDFVKVTVFVNGK